MKHLEAVVPAPLATPPVESATRIGRNVFFRFAGQVLSAAINVAGMALLGNTLGASGYGQYAFYYALIPLIASLSDLGIGAIVTREIARRGDEGPRILGDALTIKFAVSGTLLVLGGASAWILLPPMAAALLTFVLAAALMDFSQDVSVWVFRAHERQDLEALLLLVSQITWVAGIAACAVLGAPLTAYLATAVAAFALRSAVGAWILTRRHIRPVFSPRWDRIKTLVGQGLPFGLAIFAIVLSGRAGVLMLQAFASASDVAQYNVAYMLTQPLGFVSTALSMAIYPAFSRGALRGPDAVRPGLLRALKYQIVVALPLSAALFVASDRLIPLLFHREGFAGAILAVRILSAGLVFVFVNLMSRYLLTALDRQRTYLMAVLAGFAVNMTSGILLIPMYGFRGACLGQMAGDFTVFLVCGAALSRYVGAADLVRLAWKPVLAAVCMGLVLLVISRGGIILAGAAALLTYAAALLAFKGVTPEEIRVIRGVYLSFGLPGSGRSRRAVES